MLILETRVVNVSAIMEVINDIDVGALMRLLVNSFVRKSMVI